MIQSFAKLMGAAAAGLIASLSSLHAQDANWDAVVAAAKKEGKLLIYNGTGFPIVGKIADAMTKDTGIAVEVLVGRATEIRERIRIEQSTGRTVASISYSGYTTLYTQQQEGVWQDVGPLPNAKDMDPQLREIGRGQLVFGSVGLYALLYNPGLVKENEVPKSWKDIADPKWKDKILSDDLRAAGAGNVFFEATLNAFGREFHEKLAANKPVFSRNFPESERRVARGEYALYIPFNVSEYTSLRGLPIKAVQLAEGGAFVALGGAILKDALAPNAARVWLNYMLGPKGQALLAEEGFKPAVGKYASAAPAEVVPLLTGKLMGTTTPGKLDETTKLATEIYKQ